MTVIGYGGIRFTSFDFSPRFKREYRKLDYQLKGIVDEKLGDILKHPFPPGLGFEKLKGYANPDIYTIHVTGNYKISLVAKETEEDGIKSGKRAVLRRVATHNEIDRAP